MRSKAKGKRQKSSEWSGRRSTLKRWQWTSYVVFCCLLVFLVCVRCCYCYCCCRSTVCSTVCYGSRATRQELAAATKTVRINCVTNQAKQKKSWKNFNWDKQQLSSSSTYKHPHTHSIYLQKCLRWPAWCSSALGSYSSCSCSSPWPFYSVCECEREGRQQQGTLAKMKIKK